MRQTPYILGLSAVVLWLVTGCVPVPYRAPATSSALTSSVQRLIDQEAGVVCYYIAPNNLSAAISCLPIADTRLDE